MFFAIQEALEPEKVVNGFEKLVNLIPQYKEQIIIAAVAILLLGFLVRWVIVPLRRR